MHAHAFGILPWFAIIIGAIFLAVVLIKVLFLAAFALFHPHVLGVLAGVAALFLLLVGFWGVRVQSTPNVAMMQNAQQVIANNQAVVVARSDSISRAAHQSDGTTKPAESPTTDTSNTEHAEAASGSPPAWTKVRSQRKGDSWLYVVHLDSTDTALPERENMLDEQLLLAAQQYIDDHLYPGENVSKMVRLDPEYLRHKKLQTYPAGDTIVSGQDYYFQLQFDDQFRDEIERRYLQVVSWDHLQQLGNIAAVALAMLCGLYIYLRTTASKSQPAAQLETPAVKI